MPPFCGGIFVCTHMMNIKTVKGRIQVTSAFKKGKRFSLPEAMVSVRPRFCAQEYDAPKNSENSLFIVCSVKKKIAPHAVIRNRIKRLVKESVRQYVRTHTDNDNNNISVLLTLAFNWNIAPKRPLDIALKDLYPIVQQLLDNACEYFARNEKQKTKGIQE